MNRGKKRIVVALGGNALGNTPEEQIRQVRFAAEIIADLAAEGHELIIGHGNGPQVGIINSAMNYAAVSGPKTPYMPFPECGAMSQGFIGYHLQQALQQSLLKRGLGKTVVSVVTQVLVDRQDPAFENPTKPIGNFYSEKEAKELETEKGYTFMEDAGRGYRRVVPSPSPKRIIELNAIRKMVQSGLIVIAVGGGGIPVVEEEDGLHGIDAVIDKDMSSSKLAQELKADMLLILTAVFLVLGLGFSIGGAAMGATLEGVRIIDEIRYRYREIVDDVWDETLDEIRDEDLEDLADIGSRSAGSSGTGIYEYDPVEKVNADLKYDTLLVEKHEEDIVRVEVKNDPDGSIRVTGDEKELKIQGGSRKAEDRTVILYLPENIKWEEKYYGEHHLEEMQRVSWTRVRGSYNRI